MLHDNGNYVIFYGAEGSNPPCSELVNVVPAELTQAGLEMEANGHQKPPGATTLIARLGKPSSTTADENFIDATGQVMWH